MRCCCARRSSASAWCPRWNQIRAQLAAGTLANVLNAFLPPDDSLYFYYPSRVPLAETLRVFADFLRERWNAPPQPGRARRSTTLR